MLQDILDLREKKWVSRNTVAAPTTIAQVHENVRLLACSCNKDNTGPVAKEKAAQEKDIYARQISMLRGSSRRGDNREDYTQVGSDGWAVAGDLSNFGKIDKNTSMSFGPSTVFSKNGGDSKRESVSRSSSSSDNDRFAASTRAVSAGANNYGRQALMTRTSSQGGVDGSMQNSRVRSKRGEKHGEGHKAGRDAYGHGRSGASAPSLPAGAVAPLGVSANRWDRKAIGAKDDKVLLVDRKVKALLNKLSMEKFDSISDQIVEWANKSEDENDGKTLMQVIALVFEKATDEATWSEMYARLCRKMMEKLSPAVRDESIVLQDGKAIRGGQLFRKYLLNRCQEEFEHGCAVKEATGAAMAKKAAKDQAVRGANEKEGNSEVALYSDENYAAQEAEHRRLGLIKFLGELFKLQMLTERIMHTCLKAFLRNVDPPDEENLESCCTLLMTIGSMLDSPKAANHMMAYFSRITELRNSTLVSARVQFMLQVRVDLLICAVANTL
ncbi:hypothetical protein C0993_012054 [Termitomyces sp. T159_Od127]|nr:hypothetical protein C0993_012054 [Termitomyces sp. T159_Od127]